MEIFQFWLIGVLTGFGVSTILSLLGYAIYNILKLMKGG